MVVQPGDLEQLVGRRVSVALTDGSRIDDCRLVSLPRRHVDGLWLYTEGHDAIVPIDRVRDVWEASA